MNREEIIAMAIKSHLVMYDYDHPSLEAFAALVASAEREACAKLLEQAAEAAKNADSQGFVWQAVKASAEVIRARGQA